MSQHKLSNILNDFFDHIYVISLKKSIKRHNLFKQVLQGINYEIFWGVDGRELNLEEIKLEGLYDSELTQKKVPIGKDLTPGEIGCALSHLGVYKDILANGYQKALILEDDIAVATDAAEALSQSLSELPDQWDLLYLGYLYNTDKIKLPIKLRLYIAYPLLSLLGMKKYDAKRLRRRFPRSYSEHLDLAGFHYGTHAYAVTTSGAKKILKYQTPISMASDNAIGDMCMEELLRAFIVKKRVFHQNRKLDTTIDGRYKTGHQRTK